jgi:glutamyl-tRNA synthetase
VAKVLPFLQKVGCVADPPPCDTAPYLTKIVEAAGDRIKIAGDILDYADFYVADDKLIYDEKAFEKRINKPADARSLLAKFKEELATVEPFAARSLEAALKRFVESEDIKIGQIIHALRVAVTGKGVGFGMFETLEILGRDRCLNRIERALAT